MRGFVLEEDNQDRIAAVTPERVYILPHPALRASISHYTVFTPRPEVAGTGPLQIVPDASGCIVCPLGGGAFKPTLWGPTSRAVEVRNRPDTPLIVFVEFLPCGANRVLNMPLHAVENAVLPLAEVDPALARAIGAHFSRHYHDAPRRGHLAFADALDELFLERLNRGKGSLLANHIVAAASAAGGALRLRDLSRQTGYSERHLNRALSEKLGLGFKRLSRIVRVNRACREMAAGASSLTALAHGLDYHDQAHFIRDFKAICGVSPGTYLRRMSDFYNEELKMGGILPSR